MLHLAKQYMRYLIKGKSRFYLHSPFVYGLVEEIFRDKRHFYTYDEVEQVRKNLLKQSRSITIQDLGAGSRMESSTTRPINKMVKNAAITPKFGQLLFRLINDLKPKTMLELGTSLGISALYQAKANPTVPFTTIEGAPQLAKLAQKNFDFLKADNIKLLVGNFDDLLPQYLQSIDTLQYAFIDGNHQKGPTLSYFEQCLAKADNDSLFIFDDIHWSPDMTDCWNTICAHPKVTVSIDLYRMGLVYFRQEQTKEHFMLWF